MNVFDLFYASTLQEGRFPFFHNNGKVLRLSFGTAEMFKTVLITLLAGETPFRNRCSKWQIKDSPEGGTPTSEVGA